MSRAIIMAMHKYTPFGSEFYKPILDFQLKQLGKFQNEFDRLYLVDSNWNIDLLKYYDDAVDGKYPLATVLKVNPHLRYYDAYKSVLPQIKEDLVLLMDNDMVVYRKGNIEDTFAFLNEGYGVVTIYDTIGEYKTDKLNGKNKFCPYWFASRKELLMKFLDVEWGENMPEHETLGKLTERMLSYGIKSYEWPEDKSSIYFDGKKDEKKDLGYYHIRAGSTPAYLLATKHYGDKGTYWNYLEDQPSQEILRHCAWYQYMGGDPKDIYKDMGIAEEFWNDYMDKFKEFHGL